MAKKSKKLNDLKTKREIKGGISPVPTPNKTSLKISKIQNKKGFEPVTM